MPRESHERVKGWPSTCEIPWNKNGLDSRVKGCAVVHLLGAICSSSSVPLVILEVSVDSCNPHFLLAFSLPFLGLSATVGCVCPT